MFCQPSNYQHVSVQHGALIPERVAAGLMVRCLKKARIVCWHLSSGPRSDIAKLPSTIDMPK